MTFHTKKIKSIQYKDLGNAGFPIETPPDHIRLHSVMLAVAKPRSGKTFFITNLLRMMPFDRIIIVSSTFESNKKMMANLNINDKDVIDPNDPDAIKKIIDIVEGERDDLVKYIEDKRRYKMLMRKITSDNAHFDDDLLMAFYRNGSFEPPQHKWGGRKPTIAVFIDDAQNSKIMGPKLSNLVIKHRHIGTFPDGSRAIGVSLFIAVQNYTSQGNGLPKSIRGNATHLAVWKTGNKKELDLLALEQSGNCEPDIFYNAYNYIFDNPEATAHDFLFVDLAAKDGHSQFRKNYDEFMI